MTNVTHKSLGNNTQQKIQNQFADFLGSLDASEAHDFYQSFFTESEQIMFVKRLAIIMMLEKSVPYAHIAKVLKVSPGTVNRLDIRREAGEFDAFRDQFASMDRSKKFWKIVTALIDKNMHHYGATGWDWLDDVAE